MSRSNFGAVRLPLLAAAVLASFAVDATAQVVEKGRTFADLTASHPCNTGLTERIARVTDCDAADDIGDGEGAFQCWARCDGSAPWEAVAIGGGAGGSGDVVGPASSTDNGIVRFDSTTGKLVQDGSKVTLSDVGDMQWEGTTADAFEGNFTFADPTADWTWAWGADGTLTGATQFNLENLRLDGNTISSTSGGSINLFADGGGAAQFTVGAGGSSWKYALAGSGDSPLSGYARQLFARTQGVGAPLAMPSSASSQWSTNEGATAETYVDLPGAETGLHFTACVQDADGFRYTAASGDTIRVIDKVTAAAGYISSTTIGSCVTVTAINATEWFATSINGTWTDGTFTFDNTSLTTP